MNILHDIAHSRLTPFALMFVFFAGISFLNVFDLPNALKLPTEAERHFAIGLAGYAIIVTGLTLLLCRRLVRIDTEWKLLGLGRIAWLVLLNASWFAGFITAFIIRKELGQ